MKKIALAVFVALAVPMLAYALGEAVGGIDFFAETRRALFIKGIYIGPKVGSYRPQQDVQNVITQAWAGCGDYDFSALSNVSGGATCLETFAITAKGARFADSCSPSTNYGIDGGSALATEIELSCAVTALDTIKVRACAHLTDAGSINLTDAGYCGRGFSNQAR